jgi:hypothetical protein
MIPLDPDTDGRRIIEDEYDCIGKADGGGYKECDIVTYKKNGKITHYAKVTEVDEQGKIKKLRSKWGRYPLMDHGLTDVPRNYGDPDQVYRKKAAAGGGDGSGGNTGGGDGSGGNSGGGDGSGGTTTPPDSTGMSVGATGSSS